MDPSSLPYSPPAPFLQTIPDHLQDASSASSATLCKRHISFTPALKMSNRIAASRREALTVFPPVSLLLAPVNEANALEQLKIDASTRSTGNTNYLHTTKSDNIFAFMHGDSAKGSTGIGFLGLVIFGFLYLKERRSTVANQTSLKDAQLQIKVTEAELCSQMKLSVGQKSGIRHLANNIRSDSSVKGSLFKPQPDVHEVRRRELLEHEEVCQSLKRKATKLRISIKKTENDCGNLVNMIKNEENEVRDRDKELQIVNSHLESIEAETSSLRKSLENQEVRLNDKCREYGELTGLFLEALKKNDESWEKLSKASSSLRHTADVLLSLRKELSDTVSMNKASEKKLCTLHEELNNARQSFMEELSESKGQLNMLTEKVAIQSAQLRAISEGENQGAALVRMMTSQKEELNRAVLEKNGVLDSLNKLLNSSQEAGKSCDEEIKNIKLQLFNEEKRKLALEASHENDPLIKQLMKESSELQREYDMAKGLRSTLQSELLAKKESLQVSEAEAYFLQEKIQSFLAAEKQLQSEILRISEENQAASASLRKVKRAASYAKKKRVECEGALQEQNLIIEILRDELEQVKLQVEDLRGEKLFLVSKLKEVDTNSR